MKRMIYCWTVLLLMWLAGCSGEKAKEIIVCGGDQALIIDVDKSEGSDVNVVWNWKVSDVASELPAEYQKYMIPLDECKPVDKGTKILLTSSGGGVLLLDRKTKKNLFYAYAPMAHSADLLPGGRVVVALSTHKMGNSLELYDIRQPEQVLFRDSLYSGHGAVWMDAHNTLYALGFDELRAYSLKDWESSTPSLNLKKVWKTPVKGGHDLIRVTDNELIFTGHHGVYWFDIAKEEFTSFIPLQDRKNIKSLNYEKETGYMVYTQAEISWWTHHIYMENPKKVLTIEDIDLYKVRTFK